MSPGGLEKAFIADLASELQTRMHVYEEFKLSKDDVKDPKPADVYLDWLRRWLADTATALEGEDGRPATERLQVVEPTIRRWRSFPSKDK